MLKAVSSSLRLQILNFLFDKGPLSYTELMSSLKMNPSRDAGRFAYHLKFLLKADLIEVDVEARKYCLTELGKMVIDVADRIEKDASKPKGMLVRASRFALEEFDANKIATALMREAKMSAELAQKVAKEAEKRLLKSRIKYLTAPLVREVVNAILIEKGLEEYRHKLTRLGLPVHEVTILMDARSLVLQDARSIREIAGDAVLREYMLLKMFPRDIADAHLSGLLHINSLSSWTMKPNEIVHDLRFFYQNGLDLEKTNTLQASLPPPYDLESALSTTLSVLTHSADETAEAQTLEYFNLFLAPFAKGVDPQRIKEALQLFIYSANQLSYASLNLELAIPSFLADKLATGPLGKPIGKYGDLAEETQLLASLILDILIERSQGRPLFNPKIVVKIRSETLVNERAKALLLKTHHLADKGSVYFACLLKKGEEQAVFSGSGRKFIPDLSGDWEIDTLRTGCLGSVAVNLPRIAYECEKKEAKFLEVFKERLEMAARALEIKFAALRQNGDRLLPFLMQCINGDRYFRLENSSRLMNLVGLRETLELLYGKNYQDEKASHFINNIAECLSDASHMANKKRAKRLLPSMLPDEEACERLAQIDIDRYGFGKVKYSGTREKPFYSTIGVEQFCAGQAIAERQFIETKLDRLHVGGSLTVIELEEGERKVEELMSLTKHVTEDIGLEFFTYDRKLTYCANCKKNWSGLLHKCPTCGATSTLTVYDRFTVL